MAQGDVDAARQRSVAPLKDLYTVVAGVALAAALTTLVDRGMPDAINLQALPYAVAFLVTLVPFYHGALRHLDVTYFETEVPPRAGALMADWCLLFLESCLLLALALFVDRPGYFVLALVSLLVVDALWGIGAYLKFTERKSSTTVNWAATNLVVAPVLLVLAFWFGAIASPTDPIGVAESLTVMAIAIGRSSWDYRWNWSFYYPFVRRGG